MTDGVLLDKVEEENDLFSARLAVRDKPAEGINIYNIVLKELEIGTWDETMQPDLLFLPMVRRRLPARRTF